MSEDEQKKHNNAMDALRAKLGWQRVGNSDTWRPGVTKSPEIKQNFTTSDVEWLAKMHICNPNDDCKVQ